GQVILDIRGSELEAALEQRPFLIKPNRDELASTVKRELQTEEDTIKAMRELNDRGAEWVVITNGPESALATHGSNCYELNPPKILPVNPIGCGDCFAAGLAWGFDQGQPPTEVLKLAVAAATENAALLLPARLDPESVRKIADTI
ncbi:MAG: bifunctional hydroxymethylpyrimidine kinase/phosphomethylpyrimidine kinase, partial [Planctomycetaceae bacterium]|nr:bifunctional hydroxymethylpyrimidine kinase/phosphomethylpyrimidine kinase [Planctomycetaceae bacterium]